MMIPYATAPARVGDTVMKISTRNRFSGTITAISPGAINGTIKVDIGGGNIVTSSITEEQLVSSASRSAIR